MAIVALLEVLVKEILAAEENPCLPAEKFPSAFHLYKSAVPEESDHRCVNV